MAIRLTNNPSIPASIYRLLHNEQSRSNCQVIADNDFSCGLTCGGRLIGWVKDQPILLMLFSCVVRWDEHFKENENLVKTVQFNSLTDSKFRMTMVQRSNAMISLSGQMRMNGRVWRSSTVRSKSITQTFLGNGNRCRYHVVLNGLLGISHRSALKFVLLIQIHRKPKNFSKKFSTKKNLNEFLKTYSNATHATAIPNEIQTQTELYIIVWPIILNWNRNKCWAFCRKQSMLIRSRAKWSEERIFNDEMWNGNGAHR